MGALVCFLGCLEGLITWLTLFPVCAYLRRRSVLDVPNERSSHRQPTPRGGGLVIVASVLAGWILLGLMVPHISRLTLATYAIASGMIAVVSWVDDIRSMPAWVRFGVHSLAAILAITVFGFWETIDIPGGTRISLGWMGAPLAFFWIVGLTNAYNFMDGIDGIAGSQALVAGIGWAIVSWLAGLPALTGLSLIVAASSLGFLLHNWSPARIFMGDVGSAFLGYTFALFPLMMKFFSGDEVAINHSFLVGLLMVWPFVLDTAFTMARRARMGQNIFKPHRMHVYQRLITLGFKHATVTMLYAALSLAGVAFALGWFLHIPGCESALPAVLLLAVALWTCVIVQERSQVHHRHMDVNAPHLQRERQTQETR